MPIASLRGKRLRVKREHADVAIPILRSATIKTVVSYNGFVQLSLVRPHFIVRGLLHSRTPTLPSVRNDAPDRPSILNEELLPCPHHRQLAPGNRQPFLLLCKKILYLIKDSLTYPSNAPVTSHLTRALIKPCDAGKPTRNHE